MSTEDTCQPGDPDPTPETGPWCGAQEPRDSFICTRRPGHAGQHVASGTKHVAAVWSR